MYLKLNKLLLKFDISKKGSHFRSQSVSACTSIANLLKSSLGPVGLDKMLVDEIGNITITNDGATILKLMEIQQPTAKILAELASLQDSEVGDGTTSVVILASELLRKGVKLINRGIHPTSVITGFRLAMKESCKYIEANLAMPVDILDFGLLENCAKTSINSKFLNLDSEHFSKLAVTALLKVKTFVESNKKFKYPIKSIKLIKIHGQSPLDSCILPGYAIHVGRITHSMPSSIGHAKIACLDFELRKAKIQTYAQIIVTNPAELEQIRQREKDIIKERIEKILSSGANVILTTKGIDDMAINYFVKARTLACRRINKEDIKRVAKATGATLISSLADIDGNESFESKMLGYAEVVYEEQIANEEIIIFQNCKAGHVISLLLRGVNDSMLDEIDRSLHDAFCALKRVLESGSIVPGGGTVETALPIILEKIALTLGSREQLAVVEFANALLQIPKTLAANAGNDAIELVARLCSHHYMSIIHKLGNKIKPTDGLDLIKGEICDSIQAGVIEPAISKIKMIQLATEAAVTILRIDDFIGAQEKELNLESTTKT